MHVPVHIEVLHVSQETPKDSGLNMSCEVHHTIPTVAIRRNTNDLEPDCKPYRTIRVGGSFPRLHDIKTADFFFVVEGTNVSVWFRMPNGHCRVELIEFQILLQKKQIILCHDFDGMILIYIQPFSSINK